MQQVAALCRVAPVAVHIHAPGNVVKDFFVRCTPLDNGQYILFMTGQYGNLTSFPSLPSSEGSGSTSIQGEATLILCSG
jgi:hypothetical protein